MLYCWPGADAALDPAVLMGHYDVVPVDEKGPLLVTTARRTWCPQASATENLRGYLLYVPLHHTFAQVVTNTVIAGIGCPPGCYARGRGAGGCC